MHGAIPPLLHTPSWRGAQLKIKTGTALPFFEYLYGAESSHLLA
jgi:hypothetical protein